MQPSPPNSRRLHNSFLSSQSNKENLIYYNTWDGSLDHSENKLEKTQIIDEKSYEHKDHYSHQEPTSDAVSLKSDHNLLKLQPCDSQNIAFLPDQALPEVKTECKQIRKNFLKETRSNDPNVLKCHHERSLSTSNSQKIFQKDQYIEKIESAGRNSASSIKPPATYENSKSKNQLNYVSPVITTYNSKEAKENQKPTIRQEPSQEVIPDSVETYKRERSSLKSSNFKDFKQTSDSHSRNNLSKQLLNTADSYESRNKSNNSESYQEQPHSTQKRYHLSQTQDTNIFRKEIDFLKRALMNLEQDNYSVRRDYEEAIANLEVLREQTEKKANALNTITQENHALQKRLEEQDQSLNDLKMHVKNLELCNKNLRDDSIQQIETIQFLLSQKNTEDKKQLVLTKELDDNSKALRTITLENEGLKTKTKRLESILSSFKKSPASLEPIDDSANISVQDLQPSEVNTSTLLFENSRLFSREDHYRIKAQSLQSRVDLLENELNVLRADLKRRPSFQQQREYELKVEQLEKKLERQRSLSSDNLAGGELTFYKQFIDAIRTLLEVNTSDKIIPRVHDLLYDYKLQTKFSEAIQDMISKCLPPNAFQGKPTLKQAWRFLKDMLQEYVSTKTNQSSESSLKQTLEKISGFLHTKNVNEIWPKLKYLSEENNRMALIISKFRSLNNFEPIPLSQLEKSLDEQLSLQHKPRYSYK